MTEPEPLPTRPEAEQIDCATDAETTLDIPSFSTVSEIETRGPGGTGIRFKGTATPTELFQLIVPAAVVLAGLVVSGGLIAAGQSFWEAMAFFLVTLIVAAIARYAPKPKG